MVRPQLPIWKLYDTTEVTSAVKHYPDVRCKKCKVELKNGRPDRNMLKHALQCTHTTEQEKEQWKRVKEEYAANKIHKLGKGEYTPRKSSRKSPRRDTSPRHDSSSPTRVFPLTSPSPSAKRRKKRRTRAEHRMAVAKAFYSTGISFRCVEDPFFRALFAYELPSRKQLAEGLLDNTFAEERFRIIELVKGKKQLALVSDGWSNVNNDSVINFVMVRPDMQPIFWGFIVSGDKAHTGEYIAGIISTKIREIEEVAGKGAITSVVTDNAKNMKAAWKRLRQERLSLFCHGCSAHGVDLLVKDLFNITELQTVLQNCRAVTNFIKAHHGLWHRFRELLEQERGADHPHSRRPSLPVSTRWYSSEACIRHVIENRQVFMMTLSDPALVERCRRKKKKSGHSQRSSPQSPQQPPPDTPSSSMSSTQPTEASHWSPSPPQSQSLPQSQWTSLPLTQPSQSTQWPSPSQPFSSTPAQSPEQSQSMGWSPPPLRLTQPTQPTDPLYQSRWVQALPTNHHLPSLVVQSHESQQYLAAVPQDVRSTGARSRLDQSDRLALAQQAPQQFHPPPVEQISHQQRLPEPAQPPESDQDPQLDNVDKVMKIIRDEQFWKSGEVVLRLIHPVNECIATFERDDCCISMDYHLLGKLRNNAVYTEDTPATASSLQREMLKAIESRREKVCTPLAQVAYFLDRSKPMIYSETDGDIPDIILKTAALAKDHKLLGGANEQTFVDTLVQFANDKLRAASENSPGTPTFDPLHWWGLSNAYGCVKEFAERVFSVPTSSASSERSWSIHKFIQSKNRNRLKPKRVSKLVFIYSNLTNTGKVNTILYELFPEASDDDDPEASDDDNPA